MGNNLADKWMTSNIRPAKLKTFQSIDPSLAQLIVLLTLRQSSKIQDEENNVQFKVFSYTFCQIVNRS